MLEVELRVRDISSRAAKVKAGDREETTVRNDQVRRFSVPDDGTITITAGDAVETTRRDADGRPITDIAPGQHDNPNGEFLTAEISAKAPKPGGETQLVQEDGRLVERNTVPDTGKQRQGGGPEAEKGGKTPGPAATDREAARRR